MNIFQTAGSGITYFRRYALSSMLGIVTDVDLDAIKQPISEDRFKKALEGIANGTVKKEQITKNFKLTPAQEVQLQSV